MKRFLALLLAALMLLSCCALGEEEGGKGIIVFPKSEPDAPDIFQKMPPKSTPSGPIEVERTILGSDDRIRVKNTSRYPYSAIAYIVGKYGCGCRWYTSGFMVTKNTLMTAAHCLICQKHNKWATNMTFYFGYVNDRNYLYKYDTDWTAYAGTTFPNGYTSVNDWGYVRFKYNVGDKTGWFGMRYPTDRELESGWYTIAGYREGKMKYDTGRLRVIDSDRMWIDADILPGNSGCPVFDSNNYAVGLFTTYYNNANSGFRLNSKTYNKLVSEGLLK